MSVLDPVTGAEAAPDEQIDVARATAAVRELLLAIGEDPDRDGLRDTPARVARSYAEIFRGLRERPEDVLTTTFDIGHDELVLVRDIEVYSTCEHHQVPFHGVAHVGYIPNTEGRITGLSKIARLVDVFAKRPQVQERLTTQVADALVEHLQPRGAIVVIECELLCMTMRGVRKPGSKTVTSAVRGALRAGCTASFRTGRSHHPTFQHTQQLQVVKGCFDRGSVQPGHSCDSGNGAGPGNDGIAHRAQRAVGSTPADTACIHDVTTNPIRKMRAASNHASMN